METKKNFKDLKKLVNSFKEKGDMLLAICSFGEDGCTFFTGKASDAGIGFEKLLERGFSPKAEDGAFELAASVLFGINNVIKKKNGSSFNLLYSLGKMLDSINNDDTGEDEFNPTEEDCLQCSQYAECLKNHLAKIGVEIEIKKRPQPKPRHEQHGN